MYTYYITRSICGPRGTNPLPLPHFVSTARFVVQNSPGLNFPLAVNSRGKYALSLSVGGRSCPRTRARADPRGVTYPFPPSYLDESASPPLPSSGPPFHNFFSWRPPRPWARPGTARAAFLLAHATAMARHEPSRPRSLQGHACMQRPADIAGAAKNKTHFNKIIPTLFRPWTDPKVTGPLPQSSA